MNRRFWTATAAVALVAALFALPGAAFADDPVVDDAGEPAQIVLDEPAASGEEQPAGEPAVPVAAPAADPVSAAEGEPAEEPAGEPAVPAEEIALEPATATATAAVTAYDQLTGALDVKVSDISSTNGTARVYLSVKCGSVGPVIVECAQQSDGSWTASVSGADLSFATGTCAIEAWVVDENGDEFLAGQTSQELSRPLPVVDASVASGQTSCALTASNVGSGIDGTVSGVEFAVWSDRSNKADLKWYTASAGSSAGTWTLSNCLGGLTNTGLIHVECYATVNGERVLVGSTTFILDDPTKSACFYKPNAAAGTFTAEATISAGPFTVKSVSFNVWVGSDRSKDFHSYKCTQDSSGKWSATVDIKNHGYHDSADSGNWHGYAYVVLSNGQAFSVTAPDALFYVSNYLYVTNDAGSLTRRAVIKNPSGSGGTVWFGAWSSTNGQDDLSWYKGTSKGGNTYEAIIETRRFNNGGTCNVEASRWNGDTKLNTCATKTFQVADSETSYGRMTQLAQGFSSPTGYLILVSRDDHQVGIYTGYEGHWTLVRQFLCGNGADATPTITGTYHIGIKGYYFDSGSARCFYYSQISGNYLFHTVLYYQDPSPQRVMDGRVGVAVSHGCVRCLLDDAYYIYANVPTGTTVYIY